MNSPQYPLLSGALNNVDIFQVTDVNGVTTAALLASSLNNVDIFQVTDVNGVTTAALLASSHLHNSLKNLDEKGDFLIVLSWL